MSCSINKVSNVIHMSKLYVFGFYEEKKFLLQEMEGGSEIAAYFLNMF